LFYFNLCRTKASHQVAEANQLKNQAIRQAMGISDFYVDGSSFDPNRKAKEEAAKALALKKYK
jgi:serine/arginine repetitive matrix protein 2